MTANVFWINGDPPLSGDHAPTLRHERHAAELRKRPGRWALLADLDAGYASAISQGKITSYRPGGSFEAVVRCGRVYARYVGRPDELIPKCWPCSMGEHYEPAQVHTWMDLDDIDHAGLPAPTSPEDWVRLGAERPCGCWCAKESA